MTELILFNANVITLDDALPRARLIAIDKGRITAVSPHPDPASHRQKHSILVDCQGKTVLPGFIDAHLHFHAFAESFSSVGLSPRDQVGSISEIQTRLRQRASAISGKAWIRGRGYNEFYLVEKRHPNRWDLDRAACDHPIKITHRSGHAHVLNSLALKRVGITIETPDPPGGMIDRDLKTGEPTGLLYEMGGFLSERIPRLDSDEWEQGVRQANDRLLSLGMTSIHDATAGNGLDQWNRFVSWKKEGKLNVRVAMMLGMDAFERAISNPITGSGSPEQLRLSGVKIILDETTGRLHPCQHDLNEQVLKVHRTGTFVAIHAIEASAVSAATTAIANALHRFPKSDHRHRIEHCSACPPSLIQRIAAAGITIVSQPSFIYYNGERYLKTVSLDQQRHLYPFKSILNNGGMLAASTDCPIVPPNPFIGIHAAVHRQCETGEIVGENQRIDMVSALRMHTSWAARASFSLVDKGSIIPGKLADLIVVDGDPTRVSTDELKDLRVIITLCDGKIVWKKG